MERRRAIRRSSAASGWRASATGSVAGIRVCDTGPGVPDEARANLFQPFHGSTRQGGTGLGLAIAAEIVRAHGGDIGLIDRAGAGAIFEITIPDRPVSPKARRQLSSEPSQAARRRLQYRASTD